VVPLAPRLHWRVAEDAAALGPALAECGAVLRLPWRVADADVAAAAAAAATSKLKRQLPILSS